MKVLIISINSFQELTGGGLYLRQIVDGYASKFANVTLVTKANNSNNYITPVKTLDINKNFFADIVSRIFLLPSFHMVYFFTIFKEARTSDYLVFHSSRLGLLSWLLKRIFKDKKCIVHFDNVETILIRSSKLRFNLKSCITLIDKLLVPFSEKLAIKSSDILTTITSEDRNMLKGNINLSGNYILPICLPSKDINLSSDREKNLLFTGSFDFWPNQKALLRIIDLAHKNTSLNYVVAGRKLDLFVSGLPSSTYVPKNVTLVSDPSVEAMSTLFSNSGYYINLVKDGSGMKTKIAEALSYGQTVISYRSGAIGYESAVNSGYVIILEDSSLPEDILHTIVKTLEVNPKESSIFKFFDNEYTYKKSRKLIEGLFLHER
ncbi:hypothetical protein [Cobetia sp. 5-25-4-2]|uniref:hypothetical protein n=1 Tax=Cobetia sp. 5-25-4-2 TaxID=2737459 RepID=UPI001596A5D4|nr:hypothetical protein [Cobetia sp. 5-25-4-2]